MLSEYWQQILKDQILSDDDTKERFVKVTKKTLTYYGPDTCKVNEGDVLEVAGLLTGEQDLRCRKVKPLRLLMVKKYAHFALFENLDGNAVNNYICFKYQEIEQLRRGKLTPEMD